MSEQSAKCVSCGLLSLRNKFTHELVKANEVYRQNATFPPTHGGEREYDQHPVCFALAHSLGQEINRQSKDDMFRESEVLSVINAPRECNRFIAWMPGHSPKDHLDMDLHQKILETHRKREDEDRAWREKQSAEDKAWREKQAIEARSQGKEDRDHRDQQIREDREWRGGQATNEERRHRANLIVMGMLTIFAGLVGSAIQANWIPNTLNWLFGMPNN